MGLVKRLGRACLVRLLSSRTSLILILSHPQAISISIPISRLGLGGRSSSSQSRLGDIPRLKIYKTLAHGIGVPFVRQHGTECDYNTTILDLLSPLEDRFNVCNRKLSLQIVLLIKLVRTFFFPPSFSPDPIFRLPATLRYQDWTTSAETESSY